MKKKKFIALVLVLTITVLSFTGVVAPVAEHKNRVSFVKELSGRISDLCNKYDDPSDYDSNTIIPERLIVKSDGRIDTYDAIESVTLEGLNILQYADAESAEKALAEFTAKGLTVQYDMIRSADAVSVSGTYHSGWGYDLIETKETLSYFNLKVNSKIVVGVADTGVNYNHDWFNGSRISRTNYNYSGTGASDDEYDDNSANASYHGTGVASVLANCTPNNVKLACYKILNNQGKTTDSRLQAFYLYLTELNKKERPDILNMSYSSSYYTEIEDELLKKLYDDGMVLVGSAGNSNASASYPSALPYVISVSASAPVYNENGSTGSERAGSSNYGKMIDITAPGSSILAATAYNGSNSDTAYRYGTSYSCPMVSAGCAILLMQNNKLTPSEVKTKLQEGATPIDNPNSRTYAGAGMLNLYNLIDARKVESVEFSVKSGYFDDEFTLELSCSNDYSDIYYTTDYSFPTQDNGVKYTEPITITENTRVIAVALPRINTRQRSFYTSESYVFIKSNEDDYVITDDGVITDYTGNANAVVIPDKINGITPVKIGENAFTPGKNHACVQYVKLPDTVTELVNSYWESSFYSSELRYIESNTLTVAGGFTDSEFLYEVNMPEVTELDNYAFVRCRSLEKINFREGVVSIGTDALANTAIKDGSFPNLTYLGIGGFYSSSIEKADLPKIREIESNAFSYCSELKEINIPLAESIGKEAFYKCSSLTAPVCFENAVNVEASGFAKTYFDTIDLPSCVELGVSAFSNSYARIINIPLVECVYRYTFDSCINLEEVDLRSVKQFNTSGNYAVFYNCWKLKYLELFESADIPNIGYDGHVVEYQNLTPALEYIYAPKVEGFTNLANFNSACLRYCSNLRFIYVPSLYYNFILSLSANNPEVCIYMSEKNSFSETETSKSDWVKGNICIVSPDSAGVRNFTTVNEFGYIASNTLSFSKLEGGEYFYSNGQDTVSLPARIVNSMWENSVINNPVGTQAYTFLLDFNNDGYVNAKDYAIMNGQK